ncbi:hypothetical protein [Reichenbachiella sp.]|uniref:hypothetical protein n=1 Tax=Reichenbachiella sp. TaxID=2184521 RepID=UPI003B5C0251
MKIFDEKKLTEAEEERCIRQLDRVSTIVDVLFALMIFRLFTLMPNPTLDGFDSSNVTEILLTSYLNYAAIIIGLTLTLLYWGQNNTIFNNLKRTSSFHSVLTIVQVFTMMLYIYFVKLDLEMDSPLIIMLAQSITLALAGFVGISAWYYANRNNLISDKLTTKELDKIYLKIMPEPIVSVLTIPFAWFGPDIWSASWLLLVPVGMLSKYWRSKIVSRTI